MLVFIDESGDPGFNISAGATRFFVLAMIIFKSKEDAQEAEEILKKCLIDQKIYSEIKFSKTREAIKEVFFISAQKCNFTIRALVVDKVKIKNPTLKEKNDKFYNFFIRLLLKNDNGLLKAAIIKIDERGNKSSRKALSLYLRKQLPIEKIASIRFEHSHSNVLIQLADMVVGAIARSQKEPTKGYKWVEMLKEKVDGIHEFE